MGSVVPDSESARADRDPPTEAVGRMLAGFREYLLLVAGEELDNDLRAKAGASDLVQETLLEAFVAYPDFEGTHQNQLRAWLRRILLNNIASFRRRYRQTEMRTIARERSLYGASGSAPSGNGLAAETTSPSGKALRKEELMRLNSALDRLPDHYRQVITLRHFENRDFAAFGKAMHRSADAALMLWWRAFEQLAWDLERTNGQSP